MFHLRRKIEGTFIDAGVDWITVTAKTPEKVERLRTFAYAMLDNQLGLGYFGRPWFQSGYVGVACGHVQFGDRADGCIIRLGGTLAKCYWMTVAEMGDNVTRIDLQATFRAEEEPRLLVHRHYKEIQRKRRLFKRAPRLSKIEDDDGGYTVYTGRRCSNVFGRIYDKASESKEKRFEKCVRYEVQFNGRRAKWVALATRRSLLAAEDIANNVLLFFQERGASLRSLLDTLSQCVSLDTSLPNEAPTDVVRKLEWLARSIRPSVRHLVSLGLRAKVTSILGLDHCGPLIPIGSS